MAETAGATIDKPNGRHDDMGLAMLTGFWPSRTLNHTMALFLEILVWFALVAWAVFLVQLSINFLLVRDVSRIPIRDPKSWPSVSIVVPARDEERLIREAVTSYCTQDYPNFEVVVTDDRSTDATPEILADLQRRFPNLKVIRGQEPPPGWLGKPNALQHAYKNAAGDWILMVDADVIYAPDLLRLGMAFTLHQNAAMGVLLSRIHTQGVFESILMSAYNFLIFAVMPVFMVQRTKNKLFAIGSPVFNLIRRDALEGCGGFACIQKEVMDDSAIGYRIKRAGHRLAVAYSGPLIMRRMYHGLAEAIEGFTKNTYPTIRNVPWLLPIQYAVGGTLSFVPYYALGQSLLNHTVHAPAAVSLALMHIVFLMLVVRFRQPWYLVLTNPIREGLWWWIYARSFLVYNRKGLVWRNRTYSVST